MLLEVEADYRTQYTTGNEIIWEGHNVCFARHNRNTEVKTQ